MNRRGLFSISLAGIVSAVAARIGQSATASADVQGEWVVLGDRWAWIERSGAQPKITWTARYTDDGEFRFDEYGTYLPGFVPPEGQI